MIAWDSHTEHLGLRVTRNGVRSWVYAARAGAHGRKRTTLGRYPDMGLSDARAEAADRNARLYRGEDPFETESEGEEQAASEPEGEAALATVRARFQEFLEYKRSQRRAAKTLFEYENIFKNHVLPVIGELDTEAVTWSDVEDLRAGLAEESPVQSNRLVKVVGGFFQWCRPRGYFPAHAPLPGVGHDTVDEKRVGRSLSAEEMETVGAFLRTHWKQVPVRAIALVALTGCRPQEANGAKDGDVRDRLLYLGRTKTGRSRFVFLGAPALALVHSRLGGDSPYLFPTRIGGGPLQSARYWWDKLSDEEDVSARAYDLRHTYVNRALGAGLEMWMVKALCGHARPTGTITDTYLATGEDAALNARMVEAADVVSARIASELGLEL